MSRHRRPRAARLTPVRRVLVYGLCGGLWASGALWLVLHTFLRAAGPFGAEPHPAEPWALRAHGAFGFAGLWLLGLLWGVHVVNGWRTARRRWSGALTFAAALVLVLTGYGLYYLGDDRFRAAASVVHWGVGLAAAALFGWHRRWGWRAPSAGSADTAATPGEAARGRGASLP